MNKHSKFLLALIIPAMMMSVQGCQKDDELSVETNTVSFLSASEAKTLRINSSGVWSVTIRGEDHDWLTITPMSGTGNTDIRIEARANTNKLGERSAVFIVESAGMIREVRVTQAPLTELRFSTNELTMPYVASAQNIMVSSTIDWQCSVSYITGSGWLSFDPSGGTPGNSAKLRISTLTDNMTGSARTAKLIIGNSTIADTVFITQATTPQFYEDGEIISFVQATKGNGINVVFFADGFGYPDDYRKTSNTRYREALDLAVEAFFDIEPYTSFREYFNIYQLAAVSPAEGIGNDKSTAPINNRFGTKFNVFSGAGDHVMNADNYWDCINFARDNIPALKNKEDITVILMANSQRYGGVAQKAEDGNSRGIFTMDPSQLAYLLQHEAGGHCFGRLADEYGGSNVADAAFYQQLSAYHNSARPSQKNIAGSANRQTAPWSMFFDHADLYPEIGMFEGGYVRNTGTWRPTEDSIMRSHVLEFNAPSRWFIIERIMQLSGDTMTFDQFIEWDAKNRNKAKRSSVTDTRSTWFSPIIGDDLMVE